jgi:FtsZ-interacting cell division protein ZipA
VTTLIIVLVIIVVVLAVAAFLVRKKNREANVARAEQLRAQAATRAQSTIAPAQERAAAAEAEAEQARAAAAKAEAEAEEARVAAQQIEATHEGQVRAADRIDPRVDHRADDYAPQVPGTADHTPTPPSEVNADPTAGQPVEQPAPSETASSETAPVEQPATEQPAAGSTDDGRAPLLPRRTPGANEMPGKPIEQTDGGGGWFTKESDKDSDRA